MRLMALVFLTVSLPVLAETIAAPQTWGTSDNLPEFGAAKPLKKFYAKGFQVYVCRNKKWELHEPIATLYEDEAFTKPVGMHYGSCNNDKQPITKRNPAWMLNDFPDQEILGVGKAVHPSKEPTKNEANLAVKTKSSFKPGTLFGEIEGIERTSVVGGVKPEEPCANGNISNVSYTATYKLFDVTPNLPKDDKKSTPSKPANGAIKN